ncbi:MAG: PepSY domain-containing protein [Candidatus Heimdallarchaeota archaeon]|nr:PepSY domain-containing protein [Candidatus Heimdallarchaeota archaeon]
MRKLYWIPGFFLGFILILITALLVTAESPTTPFEYTAGDDDDTDLISTIQVSDDYDGDFTEFDLISVEDAETLALEYTTGGQVKESELEAENGNVFWEVEVVFEGNEFEIVIDPKTGSVVGAFYENESIFEALDWD